MDKKLDKKIKQWQQKLLDTSRRNPLISFRAYKRTTIKVIDEKPSEIYRQLVINAEKFDFQPIEIETEESETQIEVEEESTEFDIYDKATLSKKHTDNGLQTNLDTQNLLNNLRAIQYKAQEILEEQGYNNLFLALGMLEWYDIEHSDKRNRSPLILVPVKITKKSIRGSYQIVRTDEDPIVNLSLQEKLNENFNLNLPEISDDETFDPIEYFNQVKSIISKNDRWKVQEDIFLGFFSFANFVMFKDLEKFKNIYSAHPIIKGLAGIEDELSNKPITDYISSEELDMKRRPHDTYQVLDADSSQQEAIEVVKSGRNLVIQGPPGTGKSQTIVNLITEMLAANKKVLFVCEKMAALEVVNERLKSVGLDKFCLQIHSRKANKKDILSQLREAYDFEIKQVPKSKYLDELVTYKEKLNNYSKALHQEIPKLGNSTYWLIGQLNALKETDLLEIDLGKDFDQLDYKRFNEIVEVLETLKDRINQIGLPITHNFWGTEISSTSEQHQQTLHNTLNKFTEQLVSLIDRIESLNKSMGIDIKTINDVMDYTKLINLLSSKHIMNEDCLALENSRDYFSSIKKDLSIIEDYQSMTESITKNFEDDFLTEYDFKGSKRLLKGELSSFLKYFKREYYAIKREFKGYLKNDQFDLNYNTMLTLCNEAIALHKLKDKINKFPDKNFKPLGSLWNRESSNVKKIKLMLEWFIQYEELRVDDRDDIVLKKYILNEESIPNSIEISFKDILKKIETIITTKKGVDKQLKTNDEVLYVDGFENEEIKNISQKVSIWNKSMEELVDWTRFRKAYNQCNSVGLGKYINELIIDQELNPDKLVNQFRKKYFYNIYEQIKKENKVLGEFESLTHEKLVEKFKTADRLQMDIAIDRVKNKICSHKPTGNYDGSKKSELGILQKQFKLQRGQMALRKLFKKSPNIVQQISPCFMMSPMSVSQYLDPEKMNFDLVIFDEASQIKPEHSVGAIIRANQLVVTGDDKQLPPTSFFQKMSMEPQDGDDEDDIMLDSILDECSTMPSFTQSDLRWHYRSRDEALIQFSNIKFYSNKLYTFPTSYKDNKSLGLELHHIKDTVYDRGGSATNREEAKALMKHVLSQLQKDPSKSIGVVALSQRQQSALRQEKDLLVNANPELSKLFEGESLQTKFFIKNLETVQGDERDIIYISIGYGKDRNNKLSMNFGPINKQGGERRLNVLISRAKEKVNVFSSITGNDFDLNRTQSLGVKYLKEYLDYAQSGGDINTIYDAAETGNEFDVDNPFESSVYEQLRLAGINCIPQVGQSGYKIDFGIVDPNDKSKFILALECDGASYHSSATARDRDRLRQSVLEGFGWKFHRIWSTDWFENNKREMKKLKDAISKAQSNKKEGNINEKIYKSYVEGLDHEEVEHKSSSNDDIKIIDYKEHSINYDDYETDYWYPEGFYDLANNSYDESLKDLIVNISKTEAPIHIKQLSLRVIEHFDMTKVGSKILRTINAELNSLKETLILKNDFIYNRDQEIDFIRNRVNSDVDDNILFISHEEIENAIIYILKKEFFIPRDELVVQIRKLLGYKHTGPRIQKYLNKIIDTLDGTIIKEEEDGMYKLISKKSK